jgi:hypothetical protein
MLPTDCSPGAPEPRGPRLPSIQDGRKAFEAAGRERAPEEAEPRASPEGGGGRLGRRLRDPEIEHRLVRLRQRIDVFLLGRQPLDGGLRGIRRHRRVDLADGAGSSPGCHFIDWPGSVTRSGPLQYVQK